MAATVTTFGEWCDGAGDPWDAARDTFHPDFDYDANVAPSAALQSSLYPNVPSVFLMITPEVRLVVAPFTLRPSPGSGGPLRHCAFSGDPIDGDLPAIIDWTEEQFALAEAQVLESANTLAAWAADAAVARLDAIVAPAMQIRSNKKSDAVAAQACHHSPHGTAQWHSGLAMALGQCSYSHFGRRCLDDGSLSVVGLFESSQCQPSRPKCTSCQ